MTEKRTAKIVGPEDGEFYYAVGDLYRFLAFAGDTDGAYGLWEATVPPGGGPPPHIHSREEEGFYVIEGEITIHVDGNELTAGPGSFVNMPKGSQHWFKNNSDRTVKMLILVAPGGMENMFRETGRQVTDRKAPPPPVDAEEKARIAAIAPKYGIEIVR